MRENMRYAHYWQICARMFAITWHAWLAASKPSRSVHGMVWSRLVEFAF